jgi:hypothetical protein
MHFCIRPQQQGRLNAKTLRRQDFFVRSVFARFAVSCCKRGISPIGMQRVIRILAQQSD